MNNIQPTNQTLAAVTTQAVNVQSSGLQPFLPLVTWNLINQYASESHVENAFSLLNNLQNCPVEVLTGRGDVISILLNKALGNREDIGKKEATKKADNEDDETSSIVNTLALLGIREFVKFAALKADVRSDTQSTGQNNPHTMRKVTGPNQFTLSPQVAQSALHGPVSVLVLESTYTAEQVAKIVTSFMPTGLVSIENNLRISQATLDRWLKNGDNEFEDMSSDDDETDVGVSYMPYQMRHIVQALAQTATQQLRLVDIRTTGDDDAFSTLVNTIARLPALQSLEFTLSFTKPARVERDENAMWLYPLKMKMLDGLQNSKTLRELHVHDGNGYYFPTKRKIGNVTIVEK